MTGMALPARPHACPAPGAGAIATGLVRLADLVNDILWLRVTHQFADGGGAHLRADAVETTPVGQPVGHRPGRGRPSPRPGAGRGGADTAGPLPGTPDGPSGSDGGSDGKSDGGSDSGPTSGSGPEADHAEMWDLVGRAQAGDGEAFGQLYDRYVDTVFRFVYYRVNDRALAEDFTSETFLRALRRIGTISYQGRDIGAWFITIARNIVLDHVKSARNRLEMTTADTIEGREQAQSTESAVLRTLDSERLMSAIAQLGDEQRECIMLRFIQGMSVSETASIMGKNDGAIKALQHRAVRKLADLIGGEFR